MRWVIIQVGNQIAEKGQTTPLFCSSFDLILFCFFCLVVELVHFEDEIFSDSLGER